MRISDWSSDVCSADLLGATAVQYAGSDFLAAFVPILLIAMGLYFLLAPPMSGVDRHARTGPLGLTLIVAALGFYDGFFGPGTGSFLTLTLVALGGLGLVRAIGNTEVLNPATNTRSEERRVGKACVRSG